MSTVHLTSSQALFCYVHNTEKTLHDAALYFFDITCLDDSSTYSEEQLLNVSDCIKTDWREVLSQ